MTTLFEDLKQGLEEAIAIERGELSARRVTLTITPVIRYTPGEIRKVRISKKMTQQTFAKLMGVSTKTVEAWEKGTTHPTGAACRLIELVNNGGIETLPFVSRN